MQKIEKLEYGQFYHIYNHAVGGRDLFCAPSNYEYFFSLYDKYISPVADTYAWVLMKNHFHLLVRIKESIVYKYSDADFLNADGSIDTVRFNEVKWQTIELSSNPTASEGSVGVIKPVNSSKHFSHLFNAYSRYFNIRYQTRGTLFERPFKRKLIDNKEYLKRVILYIHNNPVRHGFCEDASEYLWSSYLTCVSIKPTKLHRNEVVGWFDNEANFKTTHNEKLNWNEMDNWLEM